MKKLYKQLCIIALAVYGIGLSGCAKDDVEDVYFSDAVSGILYSVANIVPESEAYSISDSEEITEPEYIENYCDPVTGEIYNANKITIRESYDITSNPSEFVTLSPWSTVFPGALVQGASLYDGGVPALVSVASSKRLPGTIYLSTVSGNNTQLYRENLTLSGAYVTQAMNDILGDYYESNPEADFAAQVSYEITEVRSVEELALSVGLDFKGFGQELKTSFSGAWKDDYNYVAVKLNQIFYSFVFDSPAGYVGTFTDDITSYDIGNQTGAGNPICYVKQMSYGRSFVLLYESKSNVDSLKTTLNATLNFASTETTTSLDTQIKNTYSSLNSTVVQIGGNATEGLTTAFGDADALRDFILNAKPSVSNVGAPISYMISHLSDNTNVVLSNTLKYSIDKTVFSVSNDQIVDFSVNNISIKVTPNDKRITSNRSRATVDYVNYKIYSPEGQYYANRVIYNNVIGSIDGDVGGKPGYQISENSVNIPLYTNGYTCRKELDGTFQDGTRLEVSVDMRIYTQTYGNWWAFTNNSTKATHSSETITLLFIYDSKTNMWNISTGNHGVDYKTGVIEIDGGEAKTKVTLNYNFRYNGYDLPIS
ncbi:MAG: thiol-activated cytolysin family protein [Rikenellaceae bacterium]